MIAEAVTGDERLIAPFEQPQLGSGLRHHRRYLPRVAERLNGTNGNGWVIDSLPTIHYSPVTFDGAPETIVVCDGRGDVAQMVHREGGYVAMSGSSWILELRGDECELQRGDGDCWLFAGFEAPPTLCGKFKQLVAADGKVTTAKYDSRGRLQSLEETHPSFPGEKVGLYYAYAAHPPHRDRLLRIEKRRELGSDSELLSVSTFTYYPCNDAGGCVNDLQTARTWRFEPGRELCRSGGFSYYRYYTKLAPNGFPGGLKFELNPDDVARMVHDGFSPPSAPDEMMARYAAKHYQYDSARRIALLALDSGAKSIRYRYLDSDATPGRNWARQAIESHSDGREITTYYDEARVVQLRFTRDASGRLIDVYMDRDGDGRISHVPSESIGRIVEPRTPWENLSISLA